MDGFADDSCVRGYKAGAGWGGEADARFGESFITWANNTDFDPTSSTTGQPVYKDDRNVPCLGSWANNPGILAVVCLSKQWRLGSYYRITATPTYLNPNKPWWYGILQPPDESLRDFRGVLTHEIGHWVFLKDLACSPGATMCNLLGGGAVSYAARSLTQDDLDAANSVYP